MFAAVLASDELAEVVRRRAELLRTFYAPLGLDALSIAAPAPRIVVGQVASTTNEPSSPVVWGEPLPAGLDLLEASDSELRSISGVTAAFAWSGERLRIVNNSAGPATLYEAASYGLRVYATHAVAAAIVAGLELQIDEHALAEFVALDFAGGERTLLRNVRTVAPASDITPESTRSYWPAAERWQRVRDGYEHTEHALLSTLAARIGPARVGLALTGGLDSRVGAAALNELGVRPLAFTWGNEDWPDSQGAAATAAALGFEHEVVGVRMLADDECLRALDRDARWSDGMTALAASERTWPESCEVLAVGMGGETGRAFYYEAWSALLEPRPDPATLARRLGAHGRLRGAPAETRAELARATLRWVEEAMASGARGWDVLDVLYTEQRVRRWGRSQIPPLEQNLVLLFTPAEVARGLASLPLRERLGDGFQRRFLASRGLPVEAAQVPAPSRLGLAARRLRHRVLPQTAPAPAPQEDDVDRWVEHVWAERSNARDWVRDVALAHPLVTETFGTDWTAATAAGFAEGRARTAERALRVAGVVALARALAELK